jgi:hypothetical protein
MSWEDLQEWVDQMIPGTMRIYGLGAFNVARLIPKIGYG